MGNLNIVSDKTALAIALVCCTLEFAIVCFVIWKCERLRKRNLILESVCSAYKAVERAKLTQEGRGYRL